MEREEIYANALKNLNHEYITLYNSKEYQSGRKLLQTIFYIKNLKIISLIKKIYRSKQKEKNSIVDNSNNINLFKDNEKSLMNKLKIDTRIAIYTVNIGGYDKLLQPLFISEYADFYIVSDKKPKELGIWKWIDANKFLPDYDLTNVKKARYIKTHPHVLFPEYKYSIFIDGNIRCIADICEFVKRINRNTKIAIHPHPYRDCIYKEAICCKNSGKGNYKLIKKQIKEYKNEGMPNNFGLFETNIVVREHLDEKCKKIMEDWWNEINNKSERDQLSLTYVLWKNGYLANDIGIIMDSIKNNDYVQVINHLDDYEK